jgi:hypothetical protein
MTVSRLSIACMALFVQNIFISYKNFYNRSLDFGLPGVSVRQNLIDGQGYCTYTMYPNPLRKPQKFSRYISTSLDYYLSNISPDTT